MKDLIEITFPIRPDLAPALIAFYQELAGADVLSAPQPKTTPPASPAAPTMSPAPTAETANHDQTGVPFNAAIHAPSGRLSAKGEWTLKKGVDKAAAEAWKRQHAGKPAAPTPAPTPAELNAKFGAPVWPAPAALPVHFPPVPYTTFGALYAKLAQEGKITGDDVAKLMAESGVTDPQTYVNDGAKRAHAFRLLQKFDV